MLIGIINADSGPQVTVGVGFMCPFGRVIRHPARLRRSTFPGPPGQLGHRGPAIRLKLRGGRQPLSRQ
jgi:hypothetical protein